MQKWLHISVQMRDLVDVKGCFNTPRIAYGSQLSCETPVLQQNGLLQKSFIPYFVCKTIVVATGSALRCILPFNSTDIDPPLTTLKRRGRGYSSPFLVHAPCILRWRETESYGAFRPYHLPCRDQHNLSFRRPRHRPRGKEAATSYCLPCLAGFIFSFR